MSGIGNGQLYSDEWGAERAWWQKNGKYNERPANCFTLREIRERTGYTPQTLRAYVRQGKLKGFWFLNGERIPWEPKIGGRMRIFVTKTSLEAWLATSPRAAVAARSKRVRHEANLEG